MRRDRGEARKTSVEVRDWRRTFGGELIVIRNKDTLASKARAREGLMRAFADWMRPG